MPKVDVLNTFVYLVVTILVFAYVYEQIGEKPTILSLVTLYMYLRYCWPYLIITIPIKRVKIVNKSKNQ